VLAVKFNEEVCHVTSRGERFYYHHEFEKAVCIPKKILVDFQLHFLKVVDHHLFVSEDIYFEYVNRIVSMARALKENENGLAP
jgi:hypothetical protein